MNGHGKGVVSSNNNLQTRIDKFDVTWGEELGPRKSDDKESKNRTNYASFFLEGSKYCLYDSVYLQSEEGPPYIARIAGLYEQSRNEDEGKEKRMLVRWFCRPSELPEGLPGVDYSEGCKEVFMCLGEYAMNRCNPASTIRKCTVLCIADQTWNTGYPSIDKIAAADHIFDKAYHIVKHEFRSLNFLVKKFGSVFVTGLGGQSNKINVNGGGLRRTSQSVKKPVANCSKRNDAGLLAPTKKSLERCVASVESQPPKRDYVSDLPSSKHASLESRKRSRFESDSDAERGQHKVLKSNGVNNLPKQCMKILKFRGNGFTSLTSPKVGNVTSVSKLGGRPTSGSVKQGTTSSVPIGRTFSASNHGAPAGLRMKPREGLPLPTSCGKGKERPSDHQGKPATGSGEKCMTKPCKPVTDSRPATGSGEKCMTRPCKLVTESRNVLEGKLSDHQGKPATVTDVKSLRIPSRPVLEGKLPDHWAKPATMMRQSPSVRCDPVVPAAVSDGKEANEPKKKIFNFPWHSNIGPALEQKRVLLLQNLDPWFTSCEIEAMLQELLQVSCDVRMLPPKDFSFYTSGEALVLFRTRDAATKSLGVFEDNLVLWSSDDRPVLAKVARRQPLKTSYFHGYFNADKFGLKTEKDLDKGNAVATSHCSQPNTAEYEMGVQWRLLQDRHTEAWRIAHREHKFATDQLRCLVMAKKNEST